LFALDPAGQAKQNEFQRVHSGNTVDFV
jgi:hypothetical protein